MKKRIIAKVLIDNQYNNEELVQKITTPNMVNSEDKLRPIQPKYNTISQNVHNLSKLETLNSHIDLEILANSTNSQEIMELLENQNFDFNDHNNLWNIESNSIPNFQRET